MSLNTIKCYFLDKMDIEVNWVEYTQPIYTKLNGMYGYISIGGDMNVYFFWFNFDSNTVCCDDVSDRFKIKYQNDWI